MITRRSQRQTVIEQLGAYVDALPAALAEALAAEDAWRASRLAVDRQAAAVAWLKLGCLSDGCGKFAGDLGDL
jgi:hypothetical protein